MTVCLGSQERRPCDEDDADAVRGELFQQSYSTGYSPRLLVFWGGAERLHRVPVLVAEYLVTLTTGRDGLKTVGGCSYRAGVALIYAFCDEAGQWHGDPDGVRHQVTRPVQSTLTFHPSADQPGASSPFAGQTLQVLSASIGEAIPGEITYTLDNGTSRYATAEVDELLFGSDAWGVKVWPPAAPSPVAAQSSSAPPMTDVPLYWQVSDAGRHYDLSAIAGPDGLTVEIIGADSDGRVIARLEGQLPRAHLSLVARLFLAAPANSSAANVRSAHRGGSWSDEETALLARRHHDGADVDSIAAELDRTANSIRYKLYALGLAPFPGPNTPQPRAAAHTPAYTMDELRQVHPNSHKRWEPEDDERLARRAAQGATVAELMTEFGRNENAITTRLARVLPATPVTGNSAQGGLDTSPR